MNFLIPIKPLSINAAFRGRRFKTPECTAFENTVFQMLPARRVEGAYYKFKYILFLTTFNLSDIDNAIKILQDTIVKRGIITDDRRIVETIVLKYKSDFDFIMIEIQGLSAAPKKSVPAVLLSKRMSRLHRLSQNYAEFRRARAISKKARAKMKPNILKSLMEK